MRTLKLVLFGSLMVAGLLVGPGLGTVAAATTGYTGFVCHPNGSAGGGPSTTISAATTDLTTPGNSKLTCYFPNVNVSASGRIPVGGAGLGGFGFGGIHFGGPCTFVGPSLTVAFSHRIYAVFGNTASLVCWGGVITSTDLSITKTDGVSTAAIGGSTTYTIVVSNAGPIAVSGASVGDVPPAAIRPDWTAVGSGGATGFSPSGSGPIADTVTLPVGASITYTVAASISTSATGSLTNTATVTAPAGISDPNPANNSATDTDTLRRPMLSTIVHYGGDGGPAIFDMITYSNGGTFSCASQAEDGLTSCDQTYAPGTVVTVALTDDAQFLYICPGDPFMYQSTSGPFTGSCTVTMNGDQQVFVVGNEQL